MSTRNEVMEPVVPVTGALPPAWLGGFEGSAPGSPEVLLVPFPDPWGSLKSRFMALMTGFEEAASIKPITCQTSSSSKEVGGWSHGSTCNVITIGGKYTVIHGKGGQK